MKPRLLQVRGASLSKRHRPSCRSSPPLSSQIKLCFGLRRLPRNLIQYALALQRLAKPLRPNQCSCLGIHRQRPDRERHLSLPSGLTFLGKIEPNQPQKIPSKVNFAPATLPHAHWWMNILRISCGFNVTNLVTINRNRGNSPLSSEKPGIKTCEGDGK